MSTVAKGQLLALIAGLGNLNILQHLYRRVVITAEVREEILRGGGRGFGVEIFEAAHWLDLQEEPTVISPFLERVLDRGEASVIQWALAQGVETVCIDEVVGRRFARLHGLRVTGSVGVLLRAKKEGHVVSVRQALNSMRQKGIWLSDRVVRFALKEAGESE